MSRIFDALQRSGTEQSGIEYPDMVAVATEVLEAPQEISIAVADPAAEVSNFAIPTELAESLTQASEAARAAFPTLQVSLPRSSRLVVLTEPDSLAAEKFRFLGVRLRQMQRKRPLKKVLVTSSIPQEGKSLVSANLSQIASQLSSNQTQQQALMDVISNSGKYNLFTIEGQ